MPDCAGHTFALRLSSIEAIPIRSSRSVLAEKNIKKEFDFYLVLLSLN
ncbi:MAG: hypothetical protein GY860_15120 [Desulfobacteraceae bacterium]|nr:hypothetical protein [Desulfobacteraceae bacterium]